MVSAAWTFDNVTTDVYGVYNGQLINGATYSINNATIPYLGQGHALTLTASQNQSFEVISPFFNLAYRSFTIEAWIYATTVTGDYGIFSQCQCASCANQCFHFNIRSSNLHAGFTLNDVTGSQTLSANTWYHVTFVYDYSNKQQILYLNGVQDNSKSNADPYQGTNGSIVIGASKTHPLTNFFSGYIDNVKLTTRAKSSSEVLTAASLIAYYSFDLPNPTYDNGPNGLNGSSSNVATVAGRVNEAMQFTTSSSYFRAYGFYQAGFGVNYNQPFSVSLWINPSSTSRCTIVQMSRSANRSSCFNMIGLWSYTDRTIQIVAQGYAWPAVYGSFVTVNTWTHVSWTFELSTGYSLYVNGVLFGTTGYYSYTGTSRVINWLQIGYSFSCSSAYITNRAFFGIIDEIYVHNRQLSASEVYALANP